LTVRDSSGFLTCVWFEGAEWYRKAFEPGEVLALSAVPSFDSYGRIQFVHPEFDRLRGCAAGCMGSALTAGGGFGGWLDRASLPG